VATALFTAAFRYGDPNTPLLLQKLQPLFAIGAATVLLGERLRPRFGGFAVVAIAGAWLITFPDPFEVSATAGVAGALAVGAAALWGMGTVLGRHMTSHLAPAEITALRFGIGLPASAVLVVITGGTESFVIGGGDVFPLVLLALIPGLLALSIYYRGLRTTPASIATLAELAFPLSAIVLNYLIFGAVLNASQVAGIALLAGVLVVMSRMARNDGSQGLGVDEAETVAA
jgi:drug/metabolite transporter (DMT)-like permease